MKDILIKNIDNTTINKIDILANKKGLSRNEYLISYFNRIAEEDILFCVFSRYETLLNRVEIELQKSRKCIERIGY